MKRVESQNSEERYRRLFEQIPIGLYSTGQDGRILEANPAMVALLGYPDKESLLKTNVKDLYVNPGDFRNQHILLDQDGIVRGYELQLRRFESA